MSNRRVVEHCLFSTADYVVPVFHCHSTGIVSLQKYLLPPAAPVLNLLYAVGLLLGFEPAQLRNVCGDADWQAIQKVNLFAKKRVSLFCSSI